MIKPTMLRSAIMHHGTTAGRACRDGFVVPALTGVSRMPLTLGVTLLAIIATMVRQAMPFSHGPLTDWLTHGSALHLACDGAAWLLIAGWVECRAGTRSLLRWMMIGWAAALLGHHLAYPQFAHVFGLSAIVYAVGVAGVVRMGLPAWWAWIALAAVAARLGDELLRDTSLLTAMGDPGLAPVPIVHAVAAAAGLMIGVAERWERGRRTASAPPVSRMRDERAADRA